MSEKITVKGFAVCQACQLSGHDGDSCRANELSNGDTWCINCGCYSLPLSSSTSALFGLPSKVKAVVVALMREKELYVPKLRIMSAQFGPDGTASQAAAACAQGNEGVILNGGRVVFSGDKYNFARMELRFQADELDEVPDFSGAAAHPSTKDGFADEQVTQFLRQLKAHGCPPVLETAIAKLMAFGFTVRHLDFGSSSNRRILLHCGGNIANTAIPKGIMVEASYLV
ncbi:MAG: hypothetical protein KGS72_17630 [Cyanobacteria bacterium REEB67]|nr:hypothetical protein [Cyanobacteria bacterium REEB67]